MEEKKKHKYTTHNFFNENAYCPQTKHQLRHNNSRNFYWNSRNWMGPLDEENKLQVDEKDNKN